MADVSPIKRTPQDEEFRYKAGVAEGTFYKMAQSISFINKRQFDSMVFNYNGSLDPITVPTEAIDGFQTFPFDVEIIGVVAQQHKKGSSGTTTLDLRRATNPASTSPYSTKFTSIFTTKPAFTTAAPEFSWIETGGTLVGTVTPVLAITELNAGDALAFDITTKQSGGANTVSLEVFFRPR